MKRFTAILAAAVLVICLAVVPAFAAGLEITGVTPKDGAKGRQPANMAVKLKFSEDMVGDESKDAINTGKITISNAEGKTYAFTIAHSDKYPNELWIVLNDTLESDTEYTVNVDSGIVSTSGNTTTETFTTTFKTRNVKTDSTISMVLMLGMIALMIFMTQRDTKAQMSKTDPNVALAEAKKLNPYKIAKQKKISLEEAKAYCEKERAKAQKAVDKANAERAKAEAAKQAELEAAAARIEAEMAAAHKASVYSVKAPASVKAHGGTIPRSVRNRSKAKEEAERQAAKQREQNAKGRKSKK